MCFNIDSKLTGLIVSKFIINFLFLAEMTQSVRSFSLDIMMDIPTVIKRNKVYLNRNFLPQTSPKVAPPLQLFKANIFKSMVHNHKLFPGALQFWNTWLRRVCQFVRIRITRLEEARKGSSISFVHDGIRSLHRVDLIPLYPD
jgi:hypothetical protein